MGWFDDSFMQLYHFYTYPWDSKVYIYMYTHIYIYTDRYIYIYEFWMILKFPWSPHNIPMISPWYSHEIPSILPAGAEADPERLRQIVHDIIRTTGMALGKYRGFQDDFIVNFSDWNHWMRGFSDWKDVSRNSLISWFPDLNQGEFLETWPWSTQEEMAPCQSCHAAGARNSNWLDG
jgi:hypothetical protein